MRKISLALVGVMLSASVLPAFASDKAVEIAPTVITAKPVAGDQPPAPPHGEFKGRGDHGPRGDFFKDLNLTEEQKAKFKEIRDKHRDAAKEEIDSVLTPEQRAKFKEMKDARDEKFKAREHAQGQPKHPHKYELQQEIKEPK